MESMRDMSDQPLPPVRSRRATLTGEREPASPAAPLPPYVPGRSHMMAAAGTVEPIDAAPANEPGDQPAIEPFATDDQDLVLGGWLAGGGPAAEELGEEVFGEGEDFPFEPGDDEPAELVIEAEEVAAGEAAPVDAPAFPWERSEAEAEDVAGEAIEPASERSPWEELREAAAQSIGAPDEEEPSVADLELGAAMDSADEMAGEFADRLQALADRLRTDGLRAIDNALTEGDRLDTAVAGFLTAFIAARQR